MKNITKNDIVSLLKSEIALEMNKDIGEIKENEPFSNYQIDSIKAIIILEKIEDYVGAELNPMLYWNHPTVEEFSSEVYKRISEET